jgi:hypothetical protein
MLLFDICDGSVIIRNLLETSRNLHQFLSTSDAILLASDQFKLLTINVILVYQMSNSCFCWCIKCRIHGFLFLLQCCCIKCRIRVFFNCWCIDCRICDVFLHFRCINCQLLVFPCWSISHFRQQPQPPANNGHPLTGNTSIGYF